jgi:hypothetical protein
LKFDHFNNIHSLIVQSDTEGLLLSSQGLSGFSGDKVVGVLQRLAQYNESINGGCYLEIGVFQGLTLISVAKSLKVSLAFGVDNFSQFDPRHKNQGIIQERMRLNNITNVILVDKDYEDALENFAESIGDKKIGVYFIDGPHDYRSQLHCLHLGKKYLSESAIIVVDDCNYRHVRLANRDFLLTEPEFKLIFEAYTECHPANMPAEKKAAAEKGWWNGVNILVRDPENILASMFPPTLRDRTLYIKEHLTHASRYGAVAPESVAVVSSVLALRLLTAWRQLRSLLAKARNMDKALLGAYPATNTFSEKLPPCKFNSVFGSDRGKEENHSEQKSEGRVPPSVSDL